MPGGYRPSDSTCITMISGDIDCLEDGSGWDYNFTLCNGASTPYNVGYFTLATLLPPGLSIDQTRLRPRNAALPRRLHGLLRDLDRQPQCVRCLFHGFRTRIRSSPRPQYSLLLSRALR